MSNDSDLVDDADELFDDTKKGSTGKKIKSILFLFAMFILVTSDIFVDRVLQQWHGTLAEGGVVSAAGACVQGIILVIGYIAVGALIDNDFV